MNRRSLWEQIVQQLEMRYAELGMAVVQHIKLVAISMGIAIVIGVTLGIAVSRIRKLEGPVLGTASTLQTIPSLALLGFMIPLFGIGVTPAVVALFLYSLLPIIRNTFTGITNVDKSVIEAASGMGMTDAQILFRIQLPLAFSVIMAGIRTSAVINVGTATLAAFIGGGGLGDYFPGHFPQHGRARADRRGSGGAAGAVDRFSVKQAGTGCHAERVKNLMNKFSV